MRAGVHGLHYEFIFLFSTLGTLTEMRRKEPGTQIKQVESGKWQSPHTYYLTVGFALGLDKARLHHSE